VHASIIISGTASVASARSTARDSELTVQNPSPSGSGASNAPKANGRASASTGRPDHNTSVVSCAWIASVGLFGSSTRSESDLGSL
jgi:hypothetical protein